MTLSPLTQEQESIASAEPDAHLLVTAGPGTGKTHTLVARLNSLVEDHGLLPGAEVLTLSFSRAAVREIRTRLRLAGSGAGFVTARTFDSFATRLLSEVDPEGSWQRLGYDGRIDEATRRLADPRSIDWLAEVKHVVIDEAQDLVGVRAALVMKLLSLGLGGFTVFGDPAQGIYDFQVADPIQRRDGSAHLYRWIRTEFPDVDERHLATNFRTRTDAARVALHFGEALNGSSPDFEEIQRSLRSVLLSTPTLGDLTSALPTLRRTSTRTVLLCRTNAEALVVSRDLHERGIQHRLKQAATDRVLGAWVANALGTMPTRVVSKKAVLDQLVDCEMPGGMDPAAAWRLLKRLDRRDKRRSDDLDLGRVASRIRAGDIPDELTAPVEDDLIVVSTVHRAKGLEFDRVIIAEPTEGEAEVPAEEARTLYVALTRARDELLHLQRIDTGPMSRRDAPDGRSVRRGWKKWQRLGIELRGDDADSETPAGASHCEADCSATQRYIARHVNRGDPLLLRLHQAWVDGQDPALYELLHDGVVVGTTRAAFGEVLFRVLKVNQAWDITWPHAIEGVRVDDVDTVAGTEAAGIRAGLGPSGLWQRVRPSGLGRFDFKEPTS